MTLTLLDLYNTAATQEWSMYDNDAASGDEFETGLILALNKAIADILFSYPFSFRERTHVVLTQPNQNAYVLPNGLIIKDEQGYYQVKSNSGYLKLIEEPKFFNMETGLPNSFYIKRNKIYFYPIPVEKSMVMIDYYTLVIGENKDGEEIYALKEQDDIVAIPPHLEEIFKNAVIARAMLNSIASESDENYSAYKKQSETAYRLLVKYAKGVDGEKKICL